MIKYIPDEVSVVFEEIPSELTLAINVSNCTHRCPECHSPHLQTDIGEELTFDILHSLVTRNRGVTCICLMGEGNDPVALKNLIETVRNKYLWEIKLGIYSGGTSVPDWYWKYFNYIKIGPYVKELGPINKETSNQRMYYGGIPIPPEDWKVEINGKLIKGWTDITYKFIK